MNKNNRYFINKIAFFWSMKSLPGYFQHTIEKTYIDKYPPSIINLDKVIKNGTLLEFGPGTGNDLVWLLQNGKLPNQLNSLESDPEAFMILSDKLYNQLVIMFKGGMPLGKLFIMKTEEVASKISSYTPQTLALFWIHFHLPLGIGDQKYPSTGTFDYVYANNSFHCMGSKAGISTALSTAYSHLKPGGVLFGRTLSDKIDSKRITEVKRKQKEIIDSALAEPPLERVECLQVFSRLTDCSTGISVLRTAIYDSQTPDGAVLLEKYNQDMENRRKYEEQPDRQEAFALATVRALQEGRLVGLPPKELEDMARSVGFAHVHTELREHPWKPTTDFYFRFERQNN